MPLITGLTLLRDVADFVLVEYHGGGDEGGIQNVGAYKGVDVDDILWDTPKVDLPEGLEEQIEEWVSPKLNDLPDWWNNEGGGGKVVIDLQDLSVKINHYVNYTKQDHSEHELELE